MSAFKVYQKIFKVVADWCIGLNHFTICGTLIFNHIYFSFNKTKTNGLSRFLKLVLGHKIS